MSDGSAQAPFSNFSGGQSFQDQVAQLCGALPGPLASHIPICTQPRYRGAR